MRYRDSSSSSAASSWPLAALTLWLELVVRAAAVSVAVLFLPLALAALVWPPVAHWCRRLADTLVALVLSKFVVAAVLSLAACAGAGGLGVSSSGNGGQFASVVTGIALLLIAILAPFTLLRLVPAVEAGAVAHLESTRHRVKSAVAPPVNNGRNLAAELAKKAGPKSEAAGAVGTTGSTGTAGAAGAAAAAAGAVGTAGAAGPAGVTGAAESGGGTGGLVDDVVILEHSSPSIRSSPKVRRLPTEEEVISLVRRARAPTSLAPPAPRPRTAPPMT